MFRLLTFENLQVGDLFIMLPDGSDGAEARDIFKKIAFEATPHKGIFNSAFNLETGDKQPVSAGMPVIQVNCGLLQQIL